MKSKSEEAGNKKAHDYWQSGMNSFWQKGQTAVAAMRQLQGEARIARADEAAGLFAKAKTVFDQGSRLL